MDLRRIREAKGWSQSHLADAAGVSLRTVQRAEAGARISGENTLALCAALDVDPMDIVPMGPPTAEAFPHLARMRDALDRAMNEHGARPIWRSSDPTVDLMRALDGDGFTPDEEGYRRAAARWDAGARRYRIRYMIASVSYDIGMVAGLVMLAFVCATALALATMDHPKHLLEAFVAITVLAVVFEIANLSIYLTGFTRRMAMGTMPDYAPGHSRGGMAPSDFAPTAAALTRDALWIVTSVEGKGISVRRLGIDIIADVEFAADTPGTKALKVRDCRTEGSRYEIGRLGEDDLRILQGMLERRTAQEFVYAAA